MRIFKTACKDNITGYELLLSECSYNTACFWLQSELAKRNLHIEDISKLKHNTLDLTELVTNNFSGCFALRFIYDETRGYLLADNRGVY